MVPLNISSLRDAASVVLLRERNARAEVLLLRRLDTMRFAAGEWVFPGGVVEDEDRSERLGRATAPTAVSAIEALRTPAFGEPLSAAAALALLIGGCRETFEETGVLLARHRDERECDAALIASLQTERVSRAADPERFVTLLEHHELLLSTDRLIYWSNWITPPVTPRRFDTRFFVALFPAHQHVDAQLGEAQAARWMPLVEAAFTCDIDPPITAPPTLLTLRELAASYERCGSLERMMENARGTAPITVMLKVTQRDDTLEALCPWNDAYADSAGDGVPCTEALRLRLGQFPSRLSIPRPPKASSDSTKART